METGEIVNCRRLHWLLVLPAAAILSAGCASPDVYYWGHYEALVYATYEKPDKAAPERQAELMEEDLQKAASANKPVPPGFHAHLGYVYYQMGKLDLAQKEFEAEKNLYPESTVFMDRLLAGLVKK